MSEKRDNVRVHVAGPVTGEVTVYQPMTVLDIAARGALIETPFPLQLEALHDFRLSLGPRSVVVKGRIVHSQIGELQQGAVVYRTGIEFIEPTPHAQVAIDAFVDAQRSVRSSLLIVDAEIA